jgi:hypothetical protein
MPVKILMTAGAKGGTGKSTFSGYVVNWLRNAGVAPYLIDCDDENSTLSRFFETERIAPTRVKSYYRIIDIAEKGDHPIIVCDLKGGVKNSIMQLVADIPFEELLELGITFLLMGVLTSSPDATSSFLGWVNCLGSRVRYLVVRNLKDSSDPTGLDLKSLEFPEYDATKQALEFRRRYKPAEIIMPGLDPEYQAELERANITIPDVLAKRPGVPSALSSLIVRSKLRRYQEGLFAQFETHKHLLLP